MRFGRKAILAVGASMGLLAWGAPVFAHGHGSIQAGSLVQNGSNGGGTCNFEVTGFQVVGSTQFPLSSLTMAITVEEVTNDGGPWYFPDPSLVSNNPEALPQIDIYDGSGNLVAGPLSPNAVSPSNPTPSVNYPSPNTATADYTYSLTSALNAGSYTVDLVPNNGGKVFHLYNSSTEVGASTTPVCLPQSPPVGQLPEVPFAAGIPLLGIGVGAVLWYRRRQLA